MSIRCDFMIQYKDFELHFKQTLICNGVTAICGQSGSGKTTLLRLMAGLETIDRSTFIVDQNVLQNTRIFIPTEQRKIGYVGQSTKLFPFMTAKQNIQFAQKRAYQSHYTPPYLDELIETFDVAHCLDKTALQLSSGEVQRIKIIQSLVNQPSLFLFDEAVSAIDCERKITILKYLKSFFIQWELPLIITSHDQVEIDMMADEIIRI